MIDELKKLRELTETITGNGHLKDQAAEWEYALDAIPDYIYIINTKFEIKFVNRPLAERLKEQKENLYNKLCYRVLNDCNLNHPPERANCVAQGLNSAEIYLNNLNGWFTISRSPIYTKTNKLIGFICILQDITEKKQKEKEVKELLSNLQESEQKYKLLINNIVDAIWTIDTHLNFTFISPSIKNLMGYEPEEWVGHNISEFATKEDFNYMALKVTEAMKDINFNNVTFNTAMLNKQGINTPIEINAKALRDNDGNLVGFQGITKVL